MNKYNTTLCGLMAALCLGSCLGVTDELNLNKEVSLDMQIGSGGISVPLGSLNRIYLDSLIKTDGDDSVLDTLAGGRYGFSMDGQIDSVNISIGDVTINIPDPDIEPISTSFADATVDDVAIPQTSKEMTLEIASVDMTTINSQLPDFKSEFTTEEITVPVPVAGVPIPEFSIVVPEQTTPCDFTYQLPEDVSNLNKVMFGQPGVTTGQKMVLDVNLATIYTLSDNPDIRIKSLSIEFPPEFTLGSDNELNKYVPASCVSVVGNSFTIDMHDGQFVTGVGSDRMLPISFYVTEAEFGAYGTDIDFKGDIKYSLDLEVSGVSSSAGDKALKIDVEIEAKLMMSDFSVNTKAKSILLEPSEISSSYEIGGLDNISVVNYVDFDPDMSIINLAISELDMAPFNFDSESAIYLTFMEEMVFDKGNGIVYSVDNTPVGEWTTGNSLLIRPDQAMGKTIQLKVSRLNIYQYVDAEDNSVSLSNDVSYSASISVAPAQNVNSSALDMFDDKTINFDVTGNLVVTNASVVTSSFETAITDTTLISIDEKVDDALEEIKQIGLTNPAGFSFALKFNGVPSSIDKMSFHNFTVEFPNFIVVDYIGTDPRVRVESGKLIVNGDLTAYELSDYSDGFQVEGMRLVEMSFGTPVALTDDGRLSLMDQEVRINGKVGVSNLNINSGELDDVIVTPTVSFEPINVKSVRGKVNPQIDDVSEEVNISLGEEIDFLKNKQNTLTLSDPQIIINLNSTVTVPITLDLSLSSKDSDGEYIGRDICPDGGLIRLNKCDAESSSRNTTIVISKNQVAESQSGDTLYVTMSRLPELMTTIPDVINFDLTAAVDQSEEHWVDLSRKLSVCGDYKVSIPLAFDNLYIEYSDTIKDLGESLADVADMINDAAITLKAKIKSTLPLGVELVLTPLDINGNLIKDLTINSTEIGAGCESGTVSDLNLGVSVKNGALKELESIVFTAKCKTAEEESDKSLRKGQYLELYQMALSLPEGIKVDLTEEK